MLSTNYENKLLKLVALYLGHRSVNISHTVKYGLNITARWYGELPSEPALSAAKGQGWHAFLQSPGKWAGVSCHDKVVQMTESR
jgi:hypothetical protein